MRAEDFAASATPTADLLRFAESLGVPLTDRSARRLRARLGDECARRRVAAAGALFDLASAIPGIKLTPVRVWRVLDAAGGDYDAARDALLTRWRIRYDRAWYEAWSELEDELYQLDARARHAAALGDSARGALGWQVEMLLIAAADAGLPDVDRYRRDIAGIVDTEVERRYPVRKPEGWQVLDADTGTSRSAERAAARQREEQDARDLALRRTPALRQRIDKLADRKALRKDIERILNKIRIRLGQQVVNEDWRPDPERYRREVIEPANARAEARVA